MSEVLPFLRPSSANGAQRITDEMGLRPPEGVSQMQRWNDSMNAATPSRLLDSSGNPLMQDTLFNLVSGLGTPKDPTSALMYSLRLLDRNTLEQMYRSDWVSRKIVDAPAEDATREWRQWDGTPAQIEALEAEEKRHMLQKKLFQALVRSRLYGGAALVFAVKGQDPSSELDFDAVKKGDLLFVVVMNRYELMAGPRIFDVESPYYTRPEYYTVATPTFGFWGEPGGVEGGSRDIPIGKITAGGGDYYRQVTPIAGTVKIHPSRVIEFVGNELPDWRLIPLGGGWGDSVLQNVDDTLKDIGLVVGGIANMINDAKVDVIKIPDFSKKIGTTEYANRVLARFSYAMQAKSMVNSLLLDNTEEWERVQTRFQGLPDILHEYLVLAGGAADIPMSRLIGQTGSRGLGGGKGGGGEGGSQSDLRNYYDRVRSKQLNEYGPRMMPLDRVLQASALGKVDPNVKAEWCLLWQLDDETKANIAHTKATTVQADVAMGLINENALRRARINQLQQDDFYPGLDDAIDEFGEEPETEDIQVPWSRLAGAMAAALPQPGEQPGAPNGKQPATPKSQPGGKQKAAKKGGQALPIPAGNKPGKPGENLPGLASIIPPDIALRGRGVRVTVGNESPKGKGGKGGKNK